MMAAWVNITIPYDEALASKIEAVRAAMNDAGVTAGFKSFPVHGAQLLDHPAIIAFVDRNMHKAKSLAVAKMKGWTIKDGIEGRPDREGAVYTVRFSAT